MYFARRAYLAVGQTPEAFILIDRKLSFQYKLESLSLSFGSREEVVAMYSALATFSAAASSESDSYTLRR